MVLILFAWVTGSIDSSVEHDNKSDIPNKLTQNILFIEYGFNIISNLIFKLMRMVNKCTNTLS